MLKSIAILSGLVFALPAIANTVPDDIRSELSGPEKIGEVKVRFLGIRMYDAALFTKGGDAFRWTRPFALELTYARSFARERLIKASVAELERMEGEQPDHQAVATKLESCFRTVRASDRFVAIPDGRNLVRFYFNGTPTCALRHPGIRERLLGIWLSDTARDRRLSRLLRGLE